MKKGKDVIINTPEVAVAVGIMIRVDDGTDIITFCEETNLYEFLETYSPDVAERIQEVLFQ